MTSQFVSVPNGSQAPCDCGGFHATLGLGRQEGGNRFRQGRKGEGTPSFAPSSEDFEVRPICSTGRLRLFGPGVVARIMEIRPECG
jgi:hypothetical protein